MPPSIKIKPRPRAIAVIDIGSNSVRLVIFRLKTRKPERIFERSATCGLARGLDPDRPVLDRRGVLKTLSLLQRFRDDLDEHQPDRVVAIGTAAMRAVARTRAGKRFHRDAERALGHKILVISGLEEARLTALGVLASMPKAIGVCGDLGGGSLELASVNRGRVHHTITLPLGSLTLISESGGNFLKAEALMYARLSHVRWLSRMKGKNFYAIGGSWRAVGRVMMKNLGHPTGAIHGFAISAARARVLSEDIARQKAATFRKLQKKIRRRADVIPYAAAALAEIIMRMRPGKVIFSGHGVREGVVRATLSDE